MRETEVENAGSEHVAEGSEIEYTHNPPTSGPHYPVWSVFGAFDEVVPRGYWVHNLEHGAIVFLTGPDATSAQVDALRDAFDQLPEDPECGSPRALLTRDPELDDAVAVVAWDWVLEGDCVDPAAIERFVEEHRARGRENVCADGTYQP
jgi:hypothetical protein